MRRPVIRVHFGAPVALADLRPGVPGAARRATDRIIDAITDTLAPLRPARTGPAAPRRPQPPDRHRPRPPPPAEGLTRPGALITVTSVGGVVGQPFNEAYCAAKFAVEGFMESLAPVAATVGVSVCVVEPGAVASEFVANVGIDPDTAAAAGLYGPALRAYLDRSAEAFAAAQSPADAAAAVVATLTDPEPAPRVQTSAAARQFVALKLSDTDGLGVTALTAGWLR